jgi:Protein of unknown function (DUF1091)
MLQVKIQALQKKKGEFEQIMSSKYLDLCAICAGRSKAPFFIHMFIEVLKTTTPGFIHKCPYFGLTEANNFTFSRQLVAFYPNGEFKLIAFIADGRRELVKMVQYFEMF